MCYIEDAVTKQGRLRRRFLPAIYFDTSVLVDYWLSEPLDVPDGVDESDLGARLPYVDALRGIIQGAGRVTKVLSIRERLTFGEAKATAVASPLGLLELEEWHAETAFRELATDAVGAWRLRGWSKKDIGGFLRKALKQREAEAQQQKAEGRRPNGLSTHTPLEMIMMETWLNESFAQGHGLAGIMAVDLRGFGLTVGAAFNEPKVLAYLQVGLADVMHVLAARHLGCSHIASFDSDFARAAGVIEDALGMKVLPSVFG